MNRDASRPAWPKVGDKMPVRAFGPFLQEDLNAYAVASGDDNPIHLDADLARRLGLEAPPVQGMLVMSCFKPAIAAWRRDLRVAQLSAKFAQPLLRGDHVEISGRVVQARDGEQPQAIMRLMAHSGQKALVVLAEATLAPAEEC
jgi:acyl dehydratase